MIQHTDIPNFLSGHIDKNNGLNEQEKTRLEPIIN